MEIDPISLIAIALAIMGFGLIVMMAVFYFGFIKRKESSH